MNKLQPNKSTIKINCPKCGEVMVKIYPNSQMGLNPGTTIPLCRNCQNKQNKKLAP